MKHKYTIVHYLSGLSKKEEEEKITTKTVNKMIQKIKPSQQ